MNGITDPHDLPAAAKVHEVAQALRCSPDSVRRLIHEGQLRAVRIGTRFLIPRAEVLRLLGEAPEPDR